MAEGVYPGYTLAKLFQEHPTAASALRAFREAGGHIRTQTFQRVFAEYQARALQTQIGPAQPLHLRPGPGEVLKQTTARAKGLAQEALIFGRSKEGIITARRMIIPVRQLRSRRWVIEEAERRVRGFVPSVEQQTPGGMETVLGGVYIGAFSREPE